MLCNDQKMLPADDPNAPTRPEQEANPVDPDGSLRTHHVRTLTLRQAIHENAVSRIYLGVHWRMDSDEGVSLGGQIAKEIRTRLG